MEERLRKRGTETEEALKTRLANAAEELAYGQTAGNFEAVLVNADLQTCFETMVEKMVAWYPHLAACPVPDGTKVRMLCLLSSSLSSNSLLVVVW